MTLYATPLKAGFELQRVALESGQGMLEAGVEFQDGLQDSVLTGIESQQTIQRRLLTMQQVALHRIAHRIEMQSPGPPNLTQELLDVVDEQYGQLYESHDDLYDGVTGELENGGEACTAVSTDSLEVLEEQLGLLRDASEELEDQSLEAAERLDEQLAMLETQFEELQAQLDRVQGLPGVPE